MDPYEYEKAHKLDIDTPNVEGTAHENRLLKLQYVPLSSLKPSPSNPRKYSRKQRRILARSMKTLGFNAPILVDSQNRIISGHARWEAAKLLGLTEVPVIRLDHLSPAQAKAFMVADNKLAELSTWDDQKLVVIFKELRDLALVIEIEATGFEPPEIDLLIQSIEDTEAVDRADEFELPKGPPVSRLGDLWFAGSHRLYCGDFRDGVAFDALMAGETATAAFTDPPYNVPIAGHVTRNEAREFAMASGEMSVQEFTSFLTEMLGVLCKRTMPGALLYSCMDWRHMVELLSAGTAAACSLINLCVWAKTNSGMGSFYRSGHELVFVFRNGDEQHQNNIQLGRFGRNRSNVWNYPGANAFGRKNAKRNTGFHPTPKPILLVADAILDCTRHNDIVLDPFIGSGTTILAAEHTGRRCFGMEIDPLYVDTAIERWQRMSGKEARHANGETFSALRAIRGFS